MGEENGSWSSRALLYTVSIIAVIAGFANILLNRGVWYFYDTGFYIISSVALIVWGVMFFALLIKKPVTEQGLKRRSTTRRIISLGLFLAVIIERLLGFSSDEVFEFILLVIIFWVVYRMFTRRSIEEGIIETTETTKRKKYKIHVPLGIKLVSFFHYIIGLLAISAGIYFMVLPTALSDLQGSGFDLITGIILSGFISLLIGFALYRGSKVIRFIHGMFLLVVLGRILWLIRLESFTSYWYWAAIIPILFILDYFIFNVRSRAYFEQMS